MNDLFNIKNLSELDTAKLDRIHLFGSYGKGVYLNIRLDDSPQIVVRSRKGEAFFYLDQLEQAQSAYDALYTVPEDVPKDKAKFKQFILDADLDAYYKFIDSRYESFNISTEREGFSWSLNYVGSPLATYPMRNANYVKVFKTEIGAKQSLIKYLGLENER